MTPITTWLDILCVKSGITYIIYQNYAKIKLNLYDDLPIEKTLTFHDVYKPVFTNCKINTYF